MHFEKNFSAQKLFCTSDQEIKKIPVGEFHISEIIALNSATLQNNELLHSNL